MLRFLNKNTIQIHQVKNGFDFRTTFLKMFTFSILDSTRSIFTEKSNMFVISFHCAQLLTRIDKGIRFTRNISLRFWFTNEKYFSKIESILSIAVNSFSQWNNLRQTILLLNQGSKNKYLGIPFFKLYRIIRGGLFEGLEADIVSIDIKFYFNYFSDIFVRID